MGEKLEKKKTRKERRTIKSIKEKSLFKNGTRIYIDRAVNCPFTFNQGHYLYVGNQAKDADRKLGNNNDYYNHQKSQVRLDSNEL